MSREQQPTPPLEELAEIAKQRALSEAELLEGGAEYKANEQGNLRLEVTPEQISAAKQEMEVDQKGGKEKANYKRIEQRGKLLIEVSKDGERLLDSATGEPLTWFNKKIREEDGIIIATRDYGVENTLDPKTGEAMQGPAWEKIYVRDGLLLGREKSKGGREYLLDRSTGHMVSHGFEKIEKRGEHIIGTDRIFKGEVKIVPQAPELDEEAEAKPDATQGQAGVGSKEKPEQRRLAAKGRIQKDSLGYYVVSSEDQRSSLHYNAIVERGGLLIGTSTLGEHMLNPQTGEQLTVSYKQITPQEDVVIGLSTTGSKYLLDARTGEHLGGPFSNLETRDDMVIAKNSFGDEYLIDKQTGASISNFYKSIERRGKRTIGKTSWGSEEEIG